MTIHPTRDLFTVLPTQRPPDWPLRQARSDAAQRRFRLPSAASFHYRALTDCLTRLSATGHDAEARTALSHPHCRRFANLLEIYGDREQASRLEAMVLARYPHTRLAERIGLSENAVKIYEQLFFDVLPLLENTDYIIRFAIMPEAQIGAPETVRRRLTMKLLAYCCGGKALEKLFDITTPSPREYWRHPAELVQQLSTTQLLDGLADLLITSHPPPSPKAVAEQIHAIRAALIAQFDDEWPPNEMEWDGQRPDSPIARVT